MKYAPKLGTKCGAMANYRISEHAKADLNRIYRRGVREFGETLATNITMLFLIDSNSWQSNPICIKLLTISAKVTDVVYVAWTLSIIELMAIMWKSCAFWASKMSMSGFSVRQC